jgi:DNA excision repair protein ERCC-8
MNQLLLSRRLGSAGPQAVQRAQYERLLDALSPDPSVKFDIQPLQGDGSLREPSSSFRLHRQSPGAPDAAGGDALAHSGGVNVLVVDEQTGKYLISGGADSTIRLWDLEERGSSDSSVVCPLASTARSIPGSHTHALTSLSVYPFDPLPSTILTTSYDKTCKLFSIDAARIAPVHTFDVTDTPFTHSLSPIASSAALIAVGTAHPAVKLLDLRSGLATHTLPGHNGAVFSVCWSPRSEHLLTSGSADGRVLFFDVRRAHSAFACLDLDDVLGVINTEETSNYQPRAALDWNARAHTGAVTGVRWVDGGRKLVTCGHDQRIRVWDAVTGRNELVHFGPRIRNAQPSDFAVGMRSTGPWDSIVGK